MTLLHRIEGLVARSAVSLLRGLGPVRSSNLCGAVARGIGPLLPVSKVADRNLRLAMPELDAGARKRIVRGVWDNLGRTAGEFPHVGRLSETTDGPGWEVVGAEHIEALAARGGPAMLFTGHIGNWEVLPLATARRGVQFATVYRASDNPEIDALILELRRASKGANEKLFAKGAQGARQMLMHLRQDGFVGMLPDQKMNDGIRANFFGQPAMTPSALAAVALRIGCPVLPTYAQRLAPGRFRVTYEAPVPLPDTGDRAADVATLTQTVNDRLEAWVRAKPESWLWLHRRWPKEIYTNGS
ncbi:MAG: lauroyl acyltransferase [Alphaproteobacteria bacterium]|nr:MAG: lauroyl acyltransferase [Alphaproteobacteria bacterium]